MSLELQGEKRTPRESKLWKAQSLINIKFPIPQMKHRVDKEIEHMCSNKGGYIVQLSNNGILVNNCSLELPKKPTKVISLALTNDAFRQQQQKLHPKICLKKF